ncbi:type I-E CRISPR-associated protein Cas7/Cse4/CasC [Endozoicomonas sp. Mp262]|uniref:type I-E CRISPR-associated protein Cas7/Cse4/CasC n=1 Tax=Endozoicomonas sp. Mp262 TaxID=2919499 RepID=UPI0021DAB935
MSRFIQLHILTSYPPANLNRDDNGRPKTAKMGGADRLRISSQCIKRTWRTSDQFQHSMQGRLGTRTKMLGVEIYRSLIDGGIGDKQALVWSQSIAGQFGKFKKGEKDNPLIGLEIEQLVHVSAAEKKAIDVLAQRLITERRAPEKEELELLRAEEQAVDIALFGRMLASKTAHNVEAACQVAHPISVHSVTIEDDYFTAVDDLNDTSEDVGAAHIGETGFAAGLFYSYICINKEQLIDNLGGNKALADRAVAALTEAALKESPHGKQNSFGSRAYASYVLAESGDQTPRSLAVAFLKPIGRQAGDYGLAAVSALEQQLDGFDKVYGKCADARYSMNAFNGNGRMDELLAFVSE